MDDVSNVAIPVAQPEVVKSTGNKMFLKILILVIGVILGFLLGLGVISLLNRNTVNVAVEPTENTQIEEVNSTEGNEQEEATEVEEPQESATQPEEEASEETDDLGLIWQRTQFVPSPSQTNDIVWDLEVPITADINRAGLYEGYLGVNQIIEGKKYLADFSFPILADPESENYTIPTTLNEFAEFILKDSLSNYTGVALEVDGRQVLIIKSGANSLSRAFMEYEDGRFSLATVSIVETETIQQGSKSDTTGDLFLERMVKSLRF